MSTGKVLWLPEFDHWKGTCKRRKKKKCKPIALPKSSCTFWSTQRRGNRRGQMEVWIAFLLLDSFLKPTYLFPVKQQFLQAKKYIWGNSESEKWLFAGVINRRPQQWNVCHSRCFFPWRSCYTGSNSVFFFHHTCEGPNFTLPVCLLVNEWGQSAMAWRSVAPTPHFHWRLLSVPRLKKVRWLIHTHTHTRPSENKWEGHQFEAADIWIKSFEQPRMIHFSLRKGMLMASAITTVPSTVKCSQCTVKRSEL